MKTNYIAVTPFPSEPKTMSVPQKKAAVVVYDDLGNPITTIMKLETTTPTTTHTTPEQKNVSNQLYHIQSNDQW